jgi:membrane protein
MDWLARLPVLGPLVRRLMASHAYRAFEHFGDRLGDRLAGAVTYYAFLSVFPLFAVSSAIGATLMSESQLRSLQKRFAEQIPGLADQLDLHSLAANAGTVGLVSGLILLYSGLGGVDAARTSIRTIWELPEEPGNMFKRKLADIGVLLGLAVAFAITIGASALATAVTGEAAERLGLDESGAGRTLLSALAFVIAVAAGFGLFYYLLTWLPLLRTKRRAVLTGALIGAIGFELLKLLLSGYLTGVASKSMYGAFGLPVALLLWINFASRLLLFCASWMATAPDAQRDVVDLLDKAVAEDEDESGPAPTASARPPAGATAASAAEPGASGAPTEPSGRRSG